MIRTNRLALVPATPAQLAAELDGRAALEKALGARLDTQWPPDETYNEDAIRYTLASLAAPGADPAWHLYYFVFRDTHDGRDTVVGVGGFKGPPTDHQVEIGYAVTPAYRSRGLATEAAEGLVRFAFDYPQVHAVVAETLPDLHASIRVLERCGFEPAGAGSEPGSIRFRLHRSMFEAGETE